MWSDNTLNFSASVCRLCASSSEILIPIFGKGSDKERIDFKIKKCLPIIVREDDCKPKQVCLPCASKLEMCMDLVEMCVTAEYKFDSILHSRFPDLKSVEPISTPAQRHCGDGGAEDTLPALGRGWPEQLAKSDNTVAVQHDGGLIVLGKVDGDVRDDFVLMVELKYKDPLDASQAAYALDAKAHPGVYVPDSDKMQAVAYKTLAYALDGEADASLALAVSQDETSAAGDAGTADYSGGKLQQLLTYTTVQQTPLLVTRTHLLPKTITEVVEEANIAAKEIVFSVKDDAAVEDLPGGALLLSADKFKSSTSETDETATGKPKKPFPCSVCYKSFMRRSNLNAHMVTHTQVRPHVCEECGKQFCVRWDLTLHQRIHAGLFSCEYCSKAFSVHAKLKRHVRTHTGERPYSCQTCGRAFNDKRNLKSHQRTHTGERPFSCATCGRSFRVRSHLQDHHRVHTQEAPFTCDVCGKSFKWKTNLNIHLKTHSGEQFVCSECGREFTRHSELMKHRHVHTGVRCHACSVCNKSYAERNMLLKHMKLHSDHKPYSCDVCGKSFHYHWYLSSHKKLHSEEKTSNVCALCGKVFSKRSSLLAHAKCCQAL